MALCIEITPECIKHTIYGYRPNPFANGFFAVFFAICFGIHIWLGLRFRTKGYAIALTIGCLALVLGYLARVAQYFRPFDAIPFQAQVCCLIIAPAFNSAAIYLMLKHIVELFGPKWSLLKPKQYTVIFVAADVISLLLQATGGALAVLAGENKDQLELGNNVMMGGIAFQVFTLTTFAMLAVLFLVRRVRARPSNPLPTSALETWHSIKFRWFLSGLVTAFTTIYIRCVYRIAEMRGGWGNPLMRDQIAFIILEGCMILVATLAQTILHPGYFFTTMAGLQMKSGIRTSLI
ncbi:RTA1 like protein-domain-containing protein [Thelonectria olida]|uniref:RTA1 like protein-domain-containing protein n=1 Tax=Thelonectria olida TaxID=1576542 RepID=A0A9P8VSM9_9HYPO|nr:RTA1 like protein-domain-containing protein [Thelonectria olida]